jgi:hypothetical protein
VRKRLVIGAIALVVIGVCFYVLCPPRKGSVEYHKKRLLEADKVGAVAVWLNENPVPQMVRNLYWERKGNQVEFHRRALIDAGYLMERVFVISNSWASEVISAARIELQDAFTDNTYRFTVLWETGTNAVGVLGPADAMEKIGHAIRDADK